MPTVGTCFECGRKRTVLVSGMCNVCRAMLEQQDDERGEVSDE